MRRVPNRATKDKPGGGVTVSQIRIDPPRGGGEAESAPPDGINLVAVLIVLAILVVLVAVIFYALPRWFGSTLTVNIRN